MSLIPPENLHACESHQVVMDRELGCPCCRTGVESRPEEFIDDPVTASNLQWSIEPETMLELLPIMVEYLGDRDEGPL